MISDPDQLVAAFKNSGEFDKLRRELFQQAQNSDNYDAFKARLADIVKERLKSGQLDWVPPEKLPGELVQEVNRFPVVERFATETTSKTLTSDKFKDNLTSSLERILREERQKDATQQPVPPDPNSGPPPPPSS
uniref:BOD1/SHG1 domain-containing protein n=1 Tax=Mycena chlorophos TaxID=658473 RepID=A0ABQ0LRV8_MYCCL|nr:predicted protein [Mycena chlorophos]